MKIESLLENLRQKEHIPGLSIAILREQTVVLAEGYGWANLEHDVPATADTVYEIASITKLFTATAVMQLVEDGRIKLSDPIGRYLPHLPVTWRPITIRQLLSHQSGIRSYTAVDQYWQTTRLDISREELLSYVADLPLDFPPGQKYSYDNTGYYLLGFLIEAVSGRSYGDFLSERIFRPLGMASTQVNDPYAIVKNRAAGYSYDQVNHTLKHKPYYSPTGTFSAGVLLSTVNDLAKFAQSLYSDLLLTADGRAQMWIANPSEQENERKFDFSVGLGWFLVDHPHGRFAGHNGGIQGFASAFVHLLDSKTTFIVLCNQDTVAEPHQIGFELLKLGN